MHEVEMTRRQLMGSAAMTAGVAGALAALPRTALAARSKSNPAKLRQGDVILMQGDSITNCYRDFRRAENANDRRALGYGYAYLLACDLMKDHPKLDLKFYNRGISGHKVPDLKKRWDKDCIDLKPALLSILIGVNDMWHKMGGRYDGTVADYRTGFAELLEQTRQALPHVTLVVCEPFALRCGAVKASWYPEMDQRRAAAGEVAAKTGAIFVPFQSMFDSAIKAGTKPEYWADDGVHPTMAGHALMAETWRKVVGV